LGLGGVWRSAQIMASLDGSQCPAVQSIPGKRSGAWVLRGTRTPVSVVFDNLEVGALISEIMKWFHLSHEQVVAVIEKEELPSLIKFQRHLLAVEGVLKLVNGLLALFGN
jgi:uncharacterized protein (DUF433 family)